MTALYKNGDDTVAEEGFLDALRRVGIREGDIVFVHSDIRVFGKVVSNDKTTLLRSLVGVLQKSVGSHGTLVMPTFSYSFCKNEAYDVRLTHSTVGALTDFFRSEEGVRRSLNPLFSVAAWGKHADEFMQTPKDSFGKGTAFDTLRRLGGKILFFGTDLRACTFLHHVEQMHAVPYRFMKTFEGSVIDGDKTYHDTCTYFVRPLDGTIENDFAVIEPQLRTAGLLQETVVGSGRLMSVGAKELYDEAMQMLDRDPYCFVSNTAHA